MYIFKQKIHYNAGFGQTFNIGAPVPKDIHPAAIQEMLNKGVIEPIKIVPEKTESIESDYAEMTGKQLDALLIDNGLAIRGSKADKIARLEGMEAE